MRRLCDTDFPSTQTFLGVSMSRIKSLARVCTTLADILQQASPSPVSEVFHSLSRALFLLWKSPEVKGSSKCLPLTQISFPGSWAREFSWLWHPLLRYFVKLTLLYFTFSHCPQQENVNYLSAQTRITPQMTNEKQSLLSFLLNGCWFPAWTLWYWTVSEAWNVSDIFIFIYLKIRSENLCGQKEVNPCGEDVGS